MLKREKLCSVLEKIKNNLGSEKSQSIKKLLQIYAEYKTDLDIVSLGAICKLLGTVYLDTENFVQAKKYYDEAIHYFLKAKEFENVANVYNNLMIVGYYLNDNDAVTYSLNKSKEYFKKSGNETGMISVQNNLGVFLKNSKKYKRAYEIFKNILKEHIDALQVLELLTVKGNLACCCFEIDKVEEGFELAKFVEEEATGNKITRVFPIIYNCLYEYYERVEDYKSAIKYLKLIHKTTVTAKKDSFENEMKGYIDSFIDDVTREEFYQTKKENKELVEANNTITEQNNFLNTLFDTIPFAVYSLDLNETYINCNKAFASMFNCDKRTIIGRKMGFSSLSSAKVEILKKHHKLLIETKIPLTKELQVEMSSGLKDIIINEDVYYHENGEAAGILGLIQNVTEDKAHLKAVSDMGAFLKSVINSPAEVFIVAVDKDFKITFFNENYRRSVQNYYELEVSLGMDYFTRYENEVEVNKRRAKFERILKGETFSGTREYLDLDPVLILSYFYSPIVEIDGTISGITIFSYDITKLTLAQRELFESEKNLSLSNSTKDKFFSIIAHDLRSPIGGIKEGLDYILDEDNDLASEDSREFITELKEMSIHTFDLLENLLQWSQNQQGALDYDPKCLEVSPLITETVKVFKGLTQIKEICLSIDCTADTMAFIDKNIFVTIIRNLVSNAIKYTERGGDIKILVERDSYYITVAVKDNGVGMKPEVIPFITQFEKNISTYGTEGEKGSGLGLVLCEELVLKQKGKIWVDSEEGVGTTFYFTSPVCDGE